MKNNLKNNLFNKKPTKFVGMHAHSGFSTFDGMGYPQEHIDYIVDNGMNAWCLTDHGHMNGFVHAYLHSKKIQKAGVNFKFIPGCEMYLHPDLNQWKQDYIASKEAKNGDKSSQRKINKNKEKIITPLAAIVDEDDDPVGVEIDSSSLTIENENETKTSKFYDPVKRRHHLVVLPKTSIGLQRLFHLVSQGYRDGFYRFPRIDYSMLKEAARGGHLIISSACIGGNLAYQVFSHVQQMEFEELNANLLNDQNLLNKVINSIGNEHDKMVDAVGFDNAYLELQFNKLPAQHLANRAIIEYAVKNNYTDKLIVTCDSHYSDPDHWREREIYKKLGWMGNKDFDPDMLPNSREELSCELYPKNHNQVWDTFIYTTQNYNFYDPEIIFNAIERTHNIVHDEIGNIEPDCSMKLPNYAVPANTTEDNALIDLCKKGLIKRNLADKPEYIERLRNELKIIKQKRFSKYFLTMKKIIDIAYDHMLIGCARGSAGGSLVAYVLGITNIDPIEYNLLFSRFLSIDRSEMPDIDTDVSDRDKLIQLLKQELGEENVVPISNYLTFKIKSLIKDVAKFYGIEFSVVNKAISSLERDVKQGKKHEADSEGGIDISIEDALKYSKSTADFLKAYPEIAEPLEVLFKQNRALGKHAGGVIVAENIAERMPLIKAKGELQTPWVEGMSFKHLETMGWVKFDLLGLETLRMIERSIELILIKQGVKNPSFIQIRDWFEQNMSPDKIDLNDQHVYENVYHKGKWVSIFQCTNTGSQNLFKSAKPTSIIDLATLTAIYRPGPIGAKVDKMYIKAKSNPETIKYGHPLIENILKDTFGFIIFQEQVMQIAHQIAGFPEEECNAIRKMLKPTTSGDNQEKATALKEQFIAGCISNGVEKHIAVDLYEKILYFAQYGFNRSHSVAYAINSYYCAWLLTYFPTEWILAYLESTAGTKKASKALSDVKSQNYEIVPIDINEANKNWTEIKNQNLMPSFLSCKGLGDTAIDEILSLRPYTSIEDFLWDSEGNWRHKKCNKRAIDALIKIRAFNSLNIIGKNKLFSSYQHMHNVIIGNYDQLKRKNKKTFNQIKSEFSELVQNTERVDEWTFNELIKFDSDLLGTVDVDSLLPKKIRNIFKEKDIKPLDQINKLDLYWFIITKVFTKKTKTGKPYFLFECISSSSTIKKVFCWDTSNNEPPSLYTIVVGEITPNNFGLSTNYKKIKILNF
jgi:DNA-directed DNA polymerase III PolC